MCCATVKVIVCLRKQCINLYHWIWLSGSSQGRNINCHFVRTCYAGKQVCSSKRLCTKCMPQGHSACFVSYNSYCNNLISLLEMQPSMLIFSLLKRQEHLHELIVRFSMSTFFPVLSFFSRQISAFHLLCGEGSFRHFTNVTSAMEGQMCLYDFYSTASQQYTGVV